MLKNLASRLRRKTSSGRFIPEIDGFRFVAIFAVVLYHIKGSLDKSSVDFIHGPKEDWLANILVHGKYGVELFFVISGFILALPFALHYLRDARRVELKSYFVRRLTRLEPPYIIAMVVLFIAAGLTVKYTHSGLLNHLIASLFYMHNISYGELNRINAVAWSLEIEVQFYILVPLLTKIFTLRNKTKRRMILAFVILAGGLSRYLFYGQGGHFQETIIFYSQYFLCGFLLADIFILEWEQKPKHHSGWDIVSFLGWPALFILWESDFATNLFFPFAILILYIAAFRGVFFNKFFRNRWITAIGGMCYTIYLWHYPWISLIGRHTVKLSLTENYFVNILFQAVLLIPVILAGSIVLFVLIERPCMDKHWPGKLWAKIRSISG